MSSIKNINKQLIGDVNLDLGDDVFKFIQLLINKNKDYESIEKLYRSLPTGSIAKINHKLYPKKISELNDFEFIESNKDIVINLYNSIAQFNIHMKHINKFINYKLEFENLFLLGDYENSIKILNKTTEEISYSNWGIYNQFLIKEYTEEYMESVNFLKEIIKNGSQTYIHQFFNLSYIRLADSDISIKEYNEFVQNEILIKYRIRKELKPFIELYLKPFKIFKEEEINDIFIVENYSTLIDRYLNFRNIIIKLSEIDNSKAELVIIKLSNLIKDPFISKLSLFLNKDFNINLNIKESDTLYYILDLYTEGKYNECIKLSKKYLLNQAICMDIIEVYVKSHIYLNKSYIQRIGNKNSLLNVILINLHNILTKNDLTDESINILLNLSFSLLNFDISIQILNFINKIKKNNNRFIQRANHICSPVITPNIIYEFNSNSGNRKKILYDLLRKNKNKKTITFFLELDNFRITNDFNNKSFSIPEHRKILHITKILYEQEKYTDVIIKLEAILENIRNIPHIYEEAFFRLYNSYSKKNDVQKCIHLYVENYFLNKHIVNYINIEKEKEFIIDFGYKRLQVDIDLLIFCYITKVPLNFISLIYKKFMRSNGFIKPTNLDFKLFTKEKVVFFLNFICSQDILSKDYIYSKTKDIELERMKICQQLIDLDTSNAKIYIEEIIEITQNIKIKERVSEINNGKIYVDINGLKNYEFMDFEKKFIRYKKIRELSDKSYEEFYILVKKNEENSIEKRNEYVKKYLNKEEELRNVFRELFTEIRDKYLFSNDHGLDSYLSTRIRHGTITGQLRKVFTDGMLITTKDSDTNIYENNFSWIKKINFVNLNETDNFNRIMNKFSEDIDNFITYIKDTLIQITTDMYSDRLFNFSLYNHSKQINSYFYENIVNCDSSDEFIFHSLEICKNMTDENLNNIRRYFREIIKKQFVNLLETLELELRSLKDTKYLTLIQNVIKIKTEIQISVDNVALWFAINNKKNIDFILKDVIDTCQEIIKNLYSFFNLEIKFINECNDKFKGKYFINLVDCFKIFLENIVSYSKKNNVIKSDVYFKIIEKDDFILCVIKNEIIFEEDRTKTYNLIDDMIEMKNKEIQTAISSIQNRMEGNSGLVKATKIIKRSINNSNNELLFTRDDSHIIIKVKLYKQGIIL